MKYITAKITLESLVSISAGHPIRGSVDGLPEGNIAVVQMRDILDAHSISWNTATKVELPTKREPDWLQDGDILLSTRGANHYATLVSSPPSKTVAAPSLFVLRTKSNASVLPGFLCWFLNQPPAQLYFQRAATGSYILNLRRSAVEEMPVILPSIDRQQLISELFQMAAQEKLVMEQLIENRQRQLEAIASDLYQSVGALS